MNSHEIESVPSGGTLWDDKIKGLHIRVFGDRRVFYLKYRTASGKQRRPKLGDYGVLNLVQARQIAADKIRVVISGGDPDAPPVVTHTIEELYRHYQEVHLSALEPSTRIQYASIWEKSILPRFQGRPLDSITEQDATAFHHSMAETPVRANQVLAVMKSAFNLAEDWGWRPRNSNPIRYKSNREEPRERYPDDLEAVRLMKALEAMRVDNPEFVDFVWVLALSGARPSEILGTERSWIGPQGIVLPKAKWRKRGRVITLSGPAKAIIDRLPIKDGNPYLFPGRGDGMPMGRCAKQWGELLKLAGIEGLQMRDLRRYFASMALSDGATLDQVGMTLGHTQSQTTRRYAYLVPEGRQKTADTAGDKLMRLSKIANQ